MQKTTRPKFLLYVGMHKQTIKQSNNQTNKQSNNQTIKQSNNQTIKQSNKQCIFRQFAEQHWNVFGDNITYVHLGEGFEPGSSVGCE
jgi:hypothetical protein